MQSHGVNRTFSQRLKRVPMGIELFVVESGCERICRTRNLRNQPVFPKLRLSSLDTGNQYDSL